MARKKISNVAHLEALSTRGLSIHQNKNNGFVVIELDYFADPKKATPEWVAREKARMDPKQWSVEMERSWETFAGKPVYDRAFFRNQHILETPRDADSNFPILFRGWDFGGNQSVVICQLIGPRLYVLDEMPNGGTNTRAFAPEVMAYCSARYGDMFHFVDIVDPSAQWEGKTSSDVACTDVMRQFGLTPIAAPTNDPQKRIDAVTELLMRYIDGRPCLQLNPHCTMLIKGFEGGYHFPEKASSRTRIDRPLKNLFSHIHDALQYVALRVKQQHSRNRDDQVDYEANLSRPRFKFN